MGLQSGKHIEKELNEIRCRVIETAISKERADFLKQLLEHNGLEVVLAEDPSGEDDAQVTYTIGVTDVTFNPVIKVYNRELKSLDNHRVTPDYWNQKTSAHEPNYWDRSKKD